MFVHCVYFWEAEGLTGPQRRQFQEELQNLLTIEAVRQGWVGTPAATRRPVIDSTYTFALILVFADQADHDAYQEHPVHLGFVERCRSFWREVKIYDASDPD